MNILEYTAPATLEEALCIKKERGADARVIAGGTDLILRMRDKVFSPALLIDLRRISLDTISLTTDEMPPWRLRSPVTGTRQRRYSKDVSSVALGLSRVRRAADP